MLFTLLFWIVIQKSKKTNCCFTKKMTYRLLFISPHRMCTQKTWFSVHLEHSAEMLGGLWYISLAQFFGKKVLNFVYTSVWRTKYLLPQFSIFLVQEISLHFHFLKMSIRHLVVIFPVVVNRNRIRLELGFVPKYRSTTIFLARVFFCAIGGRALTITFIFNHHFFSLCQSPFFSC